MLSAVCNSKMLVIKIWHFQSLGKMKVSSHNFSKCFWVYFLQSRLPPVSKKCSLWEVEGSDIYFSCVFDDNLWLGQDGLNPVSGIYDPFPVVLMEKSE